jgi:hypothetical protein
MRRAYLKKTAFFLFVFTWFNLSPFALPEEWQELKGDHFIVFYDKGKEDFSREVLRAAERGYSEIASDLGYARYSNFWQWENRVKITIYSEKASFLKATNQPEWSIGNANYGKKEINSYSGSGEFVHTTLPHEIAHLIFRDFVGFKGEVPVWLDEGVAQWQERPKREVVKYLTRDLYGHKLLMPLRQLTRTDVRGIQDTAQATNFYIQAASVVGFLIERFGAERFTDFCRQLRDGKSLDESLRFVFPTQMRDLEELEARWLEYVSSMDFQPNKGESL